MNKNVVVTFIVIVALIILGYFLFKEGGPLRNNSETATTTPDIAYTTPAVATPVIATAAIPTVETNSSAIPSNSTVVVTGNVTPNGIPTIYWYEYGPTNTLGSKTTTQTIGSGFIKINTPGYITGLSANKTYYYKLTAQNNLGTVSGATYSFTTNNNPSPTGSIPSASTNPATGITRTGGVLNGQLNPKNATSNYWFEYGTDQNFGSLTDFQAGGNGNTNVAVSATLSNLNPLTKYYYRLNVQNQFGTVNGSTMSFTTTGPASPGVPTVDTISAKNVATSSVVMSGQLNPNGTQTTYWFEYSEDSLLGSILGTATKTQTLTSDKGLTTVSITEKGLLENTKYYFRLVARNQYGTVTGDIVSFTTKNN